MPYKLSIPGQVSELQLRCIEVLAGLVPAGGRILEVGSLFGRSTYAWAKSCVPTVTVHAIDPWQGNRGVAAMEAAIGATYGLAAFQHFTEECPNIVPHQGFSPGDFADWHLPVDLYYEDAVHTNPILRKNLDFWTGHLAVEGIVCGDDYRPRFPDVVTEVNQLADRMGRELLVVEFFWCLLPARHESAAVARVRDALQDLAAEAARLDKQNPVAYTLELLDVPQRVAPGATVQARLKLTNESRSQWHPWLTRHAVVVTLTSKERTERFGGRVTLAPLLFPPDLGREFTIDICVPAEVPPGSYDVELGIHGPDGAPLRTGRIGAKIRSIEVSN